MSSFYTQDSLRFVAGDIVTAGVIVDGVVHTFHGEIGEYTDQYIPYDPNLVATTTRRDFFIDDGRVSEEFHSYVALDDVPEQGELRRIISFEIFPDKDSKLPFGPDEVPPEYLVGDSPKDSTIIETDEDGVQTTRINKLSIPFGLIMGRLISESDGTPTFPTHIGRKVKARRHFHDFSDKGDGSDKNKKKEKEFVEFIGTIVGFEFSAVGLPQYILKITKEEKSNQYKEQVPKLSRDLYEAVHTAYPGSKFVIIDNDFKITFAPEKVGTYRQEYMNALIKAVDDRLFKDTIKTVHHQHLKGVAPYWYSHTTHGNYLTDGTKTISLHMSTEGGKFLGLKKIEPPKKLPQIQSGDVIFGIKIGGNKKISWFFSKEYPGFHIFHAFVTDPKKQKEWERDAINMAKHNHSHTPFSMLISGYFEPKVDYPVVKKFKSKYLWYLS